MGGVRMDNCVEETSGLWLEGYGEEGEAGWGAIEYNCSSQTSEGAQSSSMALRKVSTADHTSLQATGLT